MNISRGKKEQAQKVIIYGPEGIGKTTMASQFPEPVFIDTEGSTANIDVARMDRPTSFTMILEQIKYIKAHPEVCKTLVIDTADWAEQLCISEFCSKKQISGIEDIGYGKGYVYVAEDFGKMLNLLEEVKNLGINIVITAHAQMRKFEQPDELGSYDRWELKLQKKTAPMLKEWADMVLFANYKTLVVNVDNQGATKGKNKAQGGKRVMYTQHHPCWDAKNRHGLPDELPFEYKSIAHCIPVGIANNKVVPVQHREKYQDGLDSELPELPEEKTKQQAPSNAQQPSERGTGDSKPVPEQKETSKKEESSLPQNVVDLMKACTFDIYESDIMEVVTQRGYFPKGTKLINCGEEFINGWVIPFWDKICGMIKENKLARGEFIPADAADEMPFN